MSFFEYLPHEYSYACYLAHAYDLHPYESTILNMVSERYPRDVDEDCASASDSEICEEDGSDDDEVLSVSSQNLESSTSQNSILFGSFANSIIPVSCTSIVPVCDGFSIKVGEISCFLGDSCSNNGDSAITSSEEDKKSRDDESQFVISKASKKPKNQSVQAFSSMIKRRHDDKVDRFLHDHNRKKGEKLSDPLFHKSESIDFLSHHRDVFIITFDPGGVNSFRLSRFSLLVFAVAIYLSFLSMIQTQRLKSSHFVFDPGGISEIDEKLFSIVFLPRSVSEACVWQRVTFHAFGSQNHFCPNWFQSSVSKNYRVLLQNLIFRITFEISQFGCFDIMAFQTCATVIQDRSAFWENCFLGSNLVLSCLHNHISEARFEKLFRSKSRLQIATSIRGCHWEEEEEEQRRTRLIIDKELLLLQISDLIVETIIHSDWIRKMNNSEVVVVERKRIGNGSSNEIWKALIALSSC